MRILIASDTHGRLQAVKKLERRILALNPDKIVLLGDYLYNGPRNGVPEDYDPMACATILNKYASRIIGVRGNCDSRIDAALLHFPFDDSLITYLNGYRVDLVHGDLPVASLLQVQRGDILMFGHTHVYLLQREEGVVYLNPGSTSFPKNGNPPTYALMEGLRLEIRNLDDDAVLASLDLI